MAKIKSVLIANRGEIACRIIQACQEMGIRTVAVYSEADAGARHTELADAKVAIGPAVAAESYLHVAKLIAAAKAEGCNAIHPGYGFLSERATAAEAFQNAGLIWIGPEPKSIRLLGDKLGAKRILDRFSVPTLPWAEVDPEDPEGLAKTAREIGFPVLLKAASGGGGKGMRLVKAESELAQAAESASREAAASFGDATLLVEKYLDQPRHIEVQILGDGHGQVTHFGERECSAQRRHQKVIEEAPAANLSDKTRTALCEAAVRLAEGAGYANAGTVEFLVDKAENFYFLEMNSRLQVEHPVTEAVWGIDLVKAQIRVAEGERLAEIFPNRAVMQARGHALEARIYAEDPARQFAPCPGPLALVEWPTGTGIRVDTGVKSGGQIGTDYDAMIAKLTVHAPTREDAIQRLGWALARTVIFGTTTNVNYLQDILKQPKYREGRIYVKFLETEMGSWKDEAPSVLTEKRAEFLAMAMKENSGAAISAEGESGYPSAWEKL